jgi:hypothetical protein
MTTAIDQSYASKQNLKLAAKAGLFFILVLILWGLHEIYEESEKTTELLEKLVKAQKEAKVCPPCPTPEPAPKPVPQSEPSDVAHTQETYSGRREPLEIPLSYLFNDGNAKDIHSRVPWTAGNPYEGY